MDRSIAIESNTTGSAFRQILKKMAPWMICLIAGTFYSYNYYLRVAPSTMEVELLREFHINATEIGLLNTAYYISYTIMQIPVGFILDRYNIRWVIFSACLAVVGGLALFVSAQSFYQAVAGRFFIGLGSAFAYLSILKLATIWLQPNRFAIMAGLGTSMGKLAAGFSLFYLTYAVANDGFRVALSSALVVGLVIMGLISTFVRNKPEAEADPNTPRTRASTREILSYILTILRSKQMWLIGIVGMLLYLPATIFIDQWGIPYLESVHGLTPMEAAWGTSLILLGWLISSPITGMISDIIQQRRMPLIITSIIACIAFMIIFYGPPLSKFNIYALMLIIGLACGAHPLCFSLAKENNYLRFSGIATALTNALIMSGGVFQSLVGKLLDMHFSGEVIDGIRVYTESDYTFALSIIPAGFIAAIIISYSIKETHCCLLEEQE